MTLKANLSYLQESAVSTLQAGQLHLILETKLKYKVASSLFSLSSQLELSFLYLREVRKSGNI